MTTPHPLLASHPEIEEYKQLHAQVAALQARIETLRPVVLTKARLIALQIMNQHGLSAEAVSSAARARQAKPKAPARYLDPASGKTWNGHGRMPSWLEGQERSRFLVG